MRLPTLRAEYRVAPILKSEAEALGLQVIPLGSRYRLDQVALRQEKTVWVELPIAGQWLAAFRLVNKRGIPTVAELRVFPLGPDSPARARSPGRWRGEYGGAELVPTGGLTARLLRQVRIGTFKHALRAILAHHGKGGLPRAFPNYPRPTPPAARRGRPGRPDIELARIAAVYEKAYLANTSPVAAVATRFLLSPSRARDVVYRARVRGLLTPADKQGSAGGLLTAQGRALLAHPKPTTPRAQQTKRRTRHGSKR